MPARDVRRPWAAAQASFRVFLCFAAGNHYIYEQNGRVLGYTSGRYLYSETGQELGFFDGKYLYDPEGREIGYRSGRYLYSQKTGQVLGYLQGDENCDGD